MCTVGNLNDLIFHPQAEENVWSNPALNERTIVTSGKSSALTGNILRRLSGYGESSAVTLTRRKAHIPKSCGEECCFINMFLSDWLWIYQ